MRRYLVAIEDPDEAVGSIMCFLVSPSYRGKGVCTLLLNTACNVFRREKLEVAEGYPTATNPMRESSDIPWAEKNYKGPLSTYLKAGFKIHRQLEPFAIVRKQL